MKRVLAGSRVSTPPEVQRALESLFGEPVHDIRVVQYSVYVRFHWRAIATTRPNCIYLRGSAREFFTDAPLVLHEYFHVIRQWRTGDLTIPRYLMECFRRGYWDNRYEVEAREYAATEIHRYCALLARNRNDTLPPNVLSIKDRAARSA